jgi:Tfp pilus assembly protein PilX
MITFRKNRKIRNSNSKRRQRGVALVAALLTLVLIAAITAGMIILSTTETSISANFRDEQTAFFAAKAGMEEVRDRLRNTAPGTLRAAGVLPTTFVGTPNSVLYILNPAPGEVVAPWNGGGNNYPDDEICKETTTVACTVNVMTGRSMPTGAGWYTSTNANGAYAAAPVLPWKWARITLKQNNSISQYSTNGNNLSALAVCWNGTNEYADPLYTPATGCTPPNLPVYVLTALAVTPTGTRRMVQTELAEDKFPFSSPSALTLPGTSGTDVFSGGHSSQWGSDGTDHPGCGVATVGPPVHGIGVGDGSAGPPLTGDLGNVVNGLNRPNNIIGSGGAPDVANVSTTLPPNLSSVSNLQTLVSNLKADVTQPVLNCPPSSGGCSGLSNPGALGNEQIIYVNGDLILSGNTQGYGILVVTGTLTMKGSTGWNGIVLVVGQGNLQTDGTVGYNGAVVVAKTLDASGNPLPALGPSTVSVNGGGGSKGGINYSSGCINMANTLSTFHVVAIRELMN